MLFCSSCDLVFAASSNLHSNAIVETTMGRHELAFVVTDPALVADQRADLLTVWSQTSLVHTLPQQTS